jgi:hypothetical protein
MTFRFALLSAALSSLTALVAPAAHAQSSIDLSWDAPSECPQESAVRERLRALIGKPSQARRHLYAAGRIEHAGKRYRLTLSVRERDAVRERTMNADHCEDLAGAAAVALGLLIRNDRGGGTGDEKASGPGAAAGQASEANSGDEAAGARSETGAHAGDEPKTTPSAALAKKPSSDEENAKRDEREDEAARAGITTSEERRWHILLRAPAGALALGRLPKPSGGAAAALGVTYDAWRVSLTARVLGTQTIPADNAYEAGARIGHRDLALAVCRDWREGRVALAPCALAELQRETARGRGPDVTPQRASSVSLVLAGGVDAHLFLFDWLALAVTATLGVETARPQLEVTTAGDVKKLGPLELSFSVGPEWIF